MVKFDVGMSVCPLYVSADTCEFEEIHLVVDPWTDVSVVTVVAEVVGWALSSAGGMTSHPYVSVYGSSESLDVDLVACEWTVVEVVVAGRVVSYGCPVVSDLAVVVWTYLNDL